MLIKTMRRLEDFDKLAELHQWSKKQKHHVVES